MALHPRQVSWFEAEIPRNQTVFALESLAAGGHVELEEKGYQTSPCINIEIIREQLHKFDEFCVRHADELPPAEPSPEKRLLDPEELAISIVETLRKWGTELVGTRRRIRQLELEIEDLSLLEECLAAMGEDAEQLEQVTHASDLLYKEIFTCPNGSLQRETRQETDLFTTLYRGKSHDFWLVIGDPNRK